MKSTNNQAKTSELSPELQALQEEALKLHLERDILALTLEIADLKQVLYGDPSTEEAEG